jgi:hypothetical protein
VVQTRVFGHFSGQKGACRDTTKRCGDTKDRCASRRGEAEECSDRRRHEDARADRELLDGRESAPLTDASSVLG